MIGAPAKALYCQIKNIFTNKQHYCDLKATKLTCPCSSLEGLVILMFSISLLYNFKEKNSV